mmetsp:Transcript_21232/g.51306  ORF Transcript_21232/g.51306 Transcript_21232/m.51306 type:complete len:103 (-) Transcript_21232:74-382(-)
MTAFTTMASITVKEIFKDHFPSEILDTLPVQMKCTFPHPNPHYSRIKILLSGEMPHMDSKKRNLEFQGKAINLKILHGILQKMGDTDVRFSRRYKLGKSISF